MKIDILTLFPSMFDGFLNESIIKRARDKKLVEIQVINFRDFSKLSNHQVDDTPYGGGGEWFFDVSLWFQPLKVFEPPKVRLF